MLLAGIYLGLRCRVIAVIGIKGVSVVLLGFSTCYYLILA